jgi:signal transduction histidine kinase
MEVAAGLLKRRLGDRPEELELVEELLGELRRLAATVTAGLDFVRPPVLRDEVLDAGALVREALRRARARVPFRGRVELDLPESLPAARGDAEQLGTVLVNLVVNALQAMEAHPRPEGHVLRAGVTAAADGLAIEVADSGPGVPEALRERIFYPFFTTREDGSGVGLAEAQKIVASHGGVLEHVPREGGGSVFRVHLPWAGEAGAAGVRP